MSSSIDFISLQMKQMMKMREWQKACWFQDQIPQKFVAGSFQHFNGFRAHGMLCVFARRYLKIVPISFALTFNDIYMLKSAIRIETKFLEMFENENEIFKLEKRAFEGSMIPIYSSI